MSSVKRRPGLGTLVLAGFVLGILSGLFFGEMTAVLNTVGRAYIRLLQMAIVPYITVSLIAGLGRLTPEQASRIALWGGFVLLLLLSAGMVLMLLVPLAYPDWEAASYYSSSLLASPESIDFLSLYISANPFDSLANTVVPAVVLFSIFMGVAVMMSERKKPLLDLLSSLDEALVNITNFVVKLAPIGIFAIAANAAGTLDIAAFSKLQIYVWSYLLLWALMFFVLLPGLLVGLTAVSYREIFSVFRISFITAFVTGSVLVVLPMIIQGIRELLSVHGVADEETDAAVDVLIPTTFNFPSVAMLLVLSFVLFAGWYAGNPVPLERYPQFAFTSLFVAFGGSNIALPFLLDMFRLPADMFDLFLVANVINNFFFMALSAMNLVVLTLLAIFLIKRRITPRPVLLGCLLALLVVGAPVGLKGASVVMDRLIQYEFRGYQDIVSRQVGGPGIEIRQRDYEENRPLPGDLPTRLDRVESSGWLRVGYSPDALPWVFRNSAGDLVGYDMELIHTLAAGLDVGLETMRLPSSQVGHALATGQIDIYASGLMLDAALVREFSFSNPYTEVTLGLLVEDHLRQNFETTQHLILARDQSIAVLNSPSLLRALKLSLPELDFLPVDSPRDFLRKKMPGVEALIMPAEAASAWTMVYPEFTTVIPSPGRTSMPLVFALPVDDVIFEKYVNSWLQGASARGVADIARDRWILGRDTTRRAARWSIIRDVLHWVD